MEAKNILHLAMDLCLGGFPVMNIERSLSKDLRWGLQIKCSVEHETWGCKVKVPNGFEHDMERWGGCVSLNLYLREPGMYLRSNHYTLDRRLLLPRQTTSPKCWILWFLHGSAVGWMAFCYSHLADISSKTSFLEGCEKLVLRVFNMFIPIYPHEWYNTSICFFLGLSRIFHHGVRAIIRNSIH